MTFQVPKFEPRALRAGDSWQWRREDLTNFPASVWTLTYRFKNTAGGFEIVAGADGDLYAVNVVAATTAAYVAGAYDWQAQVSNGSEKHTIENGSIIVLANFFSGSAGTSFDDRSNAQKIVDAIDAMMAGRATVDQMEYEISTGNGSHRRMRYCSKAELLEIRSYYAAIASGELAAANAGAGLPDRRRTYVRFNRA